MKQRATTDPAGSHEPPVPVLWLEAEPQRLARDQADVATFAPMLRYQPPSTDGEHVVPHGGWAGELPRWPFDRQAPEGLDALLGDGGLQIAVTYLAAYPMVPPVIYPVNPEPTFEERTQTAWHVAPGGSLCLLRSIGAWRPEAAITELLAKAAGWRIEYALMKAAVVEQMTINGIVSDPSRDYLIAVAADRPATHAQEERPDAGEQR